MTDAQGTFRETFERSPDKHSRAQGCIRGESNILAMQNLRSGLLYLHLSHIYFENWCNVTLHLDTLCLLKSNWHK